MAAMVQQQDEIDPAYIRVIHIDEMVGKLGMHFNFVPPEPVVVRKINPDSWAIANGIEVGDMFLEVGGIPCYKLTSMQFRELMGQRPLTLKLPDASHRKAALLIQTHFRRCRDSCEVMRARRAKERTHRLEKYGIKTRQDYLEALFSVLDRQKRGRLTEQEVRPLMRCLGLVGDDDGECRDLYDKLCKELDTRPGVGIASSSFFNCLNAEEHNFYCSDGELAEILDELQRAATLKPRPGRRGEVGRGVSALICPPEVSSMGMTLSQPPQNLKVQKIVPGSWAEEMGIEIGDVFCEVNGIPIFMMSLAEFKWEVKRRPLTLRLQDEDEVQAAVKIQSLARMRFARSRTEDVLCSDDRQELISDVFSELDANNDDLLDAQELFACITALRIRKDPMKWPQVYVSLCKRFGASTDQGLSLEMFAALVSEAGTEYYSTNALLNRVLNSKDETQSSAARSVALFPAKPGDELGDNFEAEDKPTALTANPKDRKLVLGTYEMDMSKEGIMGEGTSSICRKGRDRKTGEILGVKVYKPPKKQEKDSSKTMLMKYTRQIQVLKELMAPFDVAHIPSKLWNPVMEKYPPHKLFMRLIDYSQDKEGNPTPDAGDGVCYVVTELAQYSMKEFIATRKSEKSPLSKENIRIITKAVMLVMAGLHAKGLVHLDLKPENLMVFDGRLKLIDVDGCVKAGTKIKITDPSISFSPCYCAPEWASFVLQEHGPYITADPYLDVWSVGCVVCELVTLAPILKPKYSHFVQKYRSHREAGFHFMDWLSGLEESPMPDSITKFDDRLSELIHQGLLACSSDDRKSCAQALSHPFLHVEKLVKTSDEPDTVQELLQVNREKLSQRRRKSDHSLSKMHHGTLWKLNTGKDPRNEKEWLQRDMWIADNGSLCYFSQKDHKRLVLIDMESLKNSAIEPLDGAAKENAIMITVNGTADHGDDGGKVFVVAATSAEDSEKWLTNLRAATVDAMPSMKLGEGYAEEMKQLSVKNRRLKVDTDYKQQYEPIFKATLWKVKAAGDRMLEEHWFQREVWLSRNGSLVYWSHKEHRELVYYTTEDIARAEIKIMPNDSSCKPWAFQVCVAAQDGVEFAPGEFAAESREMRDRWIKELERFQPSK